MTEQDIVYLDNAATTFPKPEAVYQAMDSFYRQYGGNAGRGANPLARKASALVDETRILAQTWLNAPEVVFTPSATVALNTVILGARLRAGDIVYTTPFEHNSVLRPLEHLRQTIGIEIKLIPFDKITFACDLEKLVKQFQLDKPAMVCVTQASNVTGYMPPVEQMIQYAKQANPDVVTIVDGAQVAGWKTIDMTNIDALIFSGHKSLYGPYGIAGIAFGTQWRPEPLIYGGTGTVSESIEMPVSGSSRFEAGSHNISAVAGLNASLKWLHETERDTINSKTKELTFLLIGELTSIRELTVYTPANLDSHSSVVSFALDSVLPQAVENTLGAQNIAVRAGLHCSPWVHQFMETQSDGGTVRVSIGYFNNETHIQQLIRVLQSIT